MFFICLRRPLSFVSPKERGKKTRFKRGAFYKAAPLLKISPSVWREKYHSTNIFSSDVARVVVGLDSSMAFRALRAGAMNAEGFQICTAPKPPLVRGGGICKANDGGVVFSPPASLRSAAPSGRWPRGALRVVTPEIATGGYAALAMTS